MIFRQIGGLLLALTVLIGAGCAVDPKKEALANYVNQDMLSIAQIEVVAFERYAAVTGKNYTTDQAVYNTLRDEVIPVYERFSYLLNQIRIEDEAVARAHGFYLKGSKTILKGFKLKLHGIAGKDETVIILGNRKINAGIEENLKWREQVLALKEERGLREAGRDMSQFEKFVYSLDEVIMEAGPTSN
ncbi:MAG: hypothetical protein GY697_21925 [Desulfobacterales bacterium]|nr:hypothetical protein [Desulfobacterales bacterium]